MSMVAGLALVLAGAAVPVSTGTAPQGQPFVSAAPAPAAPQRVSVLHATQARWRLPQLSQPLAAEPAPMFKWRGPIVEFRMPLPMTR